MNFFTTLVIFITKAGLQVDGDLDGQGVVSSRDDFDALVNSYDVVVSVFMVFCLVYLLIITKALHLVM